MKNNKKAIDIINNMDIDLPLSKEEENARTYNSVIKSVNENKEQKRFVGKRAFATALAAVLVFILSFYAVAAILESTMDVSIPDKISAFLIALIGLGIKVSLLFCQRKLHKVPKTK